MKRTLLLIGLLFACCVGAWATVPDIPFTVTYTCTGSRGPFSFPFPISDPTALLVKINGSVVTSTNYTPVAVNNNYNNGGSITFTTLYGPCPNGDTLVIVRDTEINQLIKFFDNMPIPMTSFERGLDKLTEIAQELKTDGIGTSIQLQNNGVDYLLPATGTVILNFTNCTVTGTQDNYSITCSGSGGSGNVIGPGASTIGHLAVWTDNAGIHIGDVPVSVDSSGNVNTLGALAALSGTFSGPPYGVNFLGFNTGTPTGFGAAGTCALYTKDSPNTLLKKCDGGTAEPVATTAGSLTSGHCAQYDASGNLTDSGAACGTASGGTAGGDLSGTYPNPTVTNGSHITNSSIPNSGLANPSTTVNSQTCTLGSTCTVTAAPSGSAGGDLSGTYPSPTVAKVNAVAYPAGPGTNTVPVVTGSNTVTYEAVPNAALANSSTTVNSQTCTLGSSCTVTAAPSGSAGGDLAGTYPNPTINTTYKKRSCQYTFGDGVNAITAATYPALPCVNNYGVTMTVAAIHAYTDNNGSTTVDVKNNAGTSFLTGAVTANNTKTSGGAAGTLGATTTLATTDGFNTTIVADGTTKIVHVTIDVTLP